MKEKELRGIFKFLSKASSGNWTFRWNSTPYMSKCLSSGKRESILGHVWGMIELWHQLRKIYQNLNAVIDSEKFYKIIINHDLGETFIGDISAVEQLNDGGQNKISAEREEIVKMLSSLPSDSAKDIIYWFDEYEKDIGLISDREILLAKFLDALQADHFALTFGNNLSENSDVISLIVNKKFISCAERLGIVLRHSNEIRASEELSEIADFHISQIEDAGIKLKINKR